VFDLEQGHAPNPQKLSGLKLTCQNLRVDAKAGCNDRPLVVVGQLIAPAIRAQMVELNMNR